MLGVARRFALVALAGGALMFALTSTAQAAFPGANGRIVFTTDLEGSPHELFDVSPSGVDLRNLTNSAVMEFKASYSPDGRRIVFGHMPFDGINELSELYVMHADGSHRRRLTFNTRPEYDAAWSPDGERLVFARRPGTAPEGEDLGPPDLWTLNVRTGEERQITNTPETEDDRPQWSPDGGRIVFNSDVHDPGNFDIYTIRPNGRDLRRITTGAAFDAMPSYSPDGKRITFTSERTGNGDIFVMRADGGRQIRLTHDPRWDFLSCFSPDGRFIAFATERGGDPYPGEPDFFRTDIFRMRADGSQQMNLTSSPAVDNYDPDWQPLQRGHDARAGSKTGSG